MTTAVADRAEAWAVWKLYAASLGPAPGRDAPDGPSADIEASPSEASPDEQAMLRTYCAANRELSRRLSAIRQQGRPTAGMRSVVSAVILFHFHRHGLDIPAHERIASAMIRALDPAGPRMD